MAALRLPDKAAFPGLWALSYVASMPISSWNNNRQENRQVRSTFTVYKHHNHLIYIGFI